MQFHGYNNNCNLLMLYFPKTYSYLYNLKKKKEAKTWLVLYFLDLGNSVCGCTALSFTNNREIDAFLVTHTSELLEHKQTECGKEQRM